MRVVLAGMVLMPSTAWVHAPTERTVLRPKEVGNKRFRRRCITYEKSIPSQQEITQLSALEEPSVRWVSPDQWIYEDPLDTEEQMPWKSISKINDVVRSGRPRQKKKRYVRVDEEATSNFSWSDALQQLSANEADGIELPLVVVDAPLLPAGSHSIAVTDERLEQLYNEILMSGGRRFVAAVGKYTDNVKIGESASQSSLPFSVVAEESQGLHNQDNVLETNDLPTVAQMACVLYLTDVTDGADGVRVCEHSVQPVRVKIQQVLKRLDGRLYCRVNVVLDEEDDEDHALEKRRHMPQDTEEMHDSETKKSNKKVEHNHGLAAIGASLLQLAAMLQEAIPWHFFLRGGDRHHRQDLVGPPSAQDSMKRGLHQRRKKNIESPIEEEVPGPPQPEYEQRIFDELQSIATLQKKLDEDVCFRDDAFANLGAGPGAGVGSLWHLANSCWLSYLRARAATRTRSVCTDLHERLISFLRGSGRIPPEFFAANGEGFIMNDPNAQRASDISIHIHDLPNDLQRDILMLKSRVDDEIEPIILQHKAAQTLLDADSHYTRCTAFFKLLQNEHKRLQARAALKTLFDSEPAGNRLLRQDPLFFDSNLIDENQEDDDKDFWRFYL